MDIYSYLKLDHQHVAKLFKQFESVKTTARRVPIFASIAQELLVHTRSEQETFYRALKKHELTQKEAFHAQVEHKEIDDLIKLILHSEERGHTWVNNILKLKEIVQHHVGEEEGPIFTHAKQVLSKEEAFTLKEQMHFLKQQLLLTIQQEKLLAPLEINEKSIKAKKAVRKSAEHRPGAR